MRFALNLDDIEVLPQKENFVSWRDILIDWNRHNGLFHHALFEENLEQPLQQTLELWR